MENNSNTAREEAFVHALTSHHDALLRFVRTLVPHASDAEDVFQRASVSLWKKHEDYDPSRSFYTWACRFVHFEVLNYRKRAARDRLSFSEDLIESLAEDQIQSEPRLENRRQALAACIGKMPSEDQKILQRRYEENSTIAELAKELKRPAKQLYKHLERIRRNLYLCVDRSLNQMT